MARQGESRGPRPEEVARARRELGVFTDAFPPRGEIPRKHTDDGDDVSPPLQVSSLPEETRALAILVEDPDAARGAFTHWLAWDLPPGERIVEGIDVSAAGGVEGKNGFGSVGYRGPAPPEGERHRYVFHVFALREPLDIDAGLARDRVEAAMEGKVLAHGSYEGVYGR